MGAARCICHDAASVIASATALIVSNYEKSQIPSGPLLRLSATVSEGSVDLHVMNDGRGAAILQGAGVMCIGNPFGKQFSAPVYATTVATPLLPAASSELLRLSRMSGANVLARGKAMLDSYGDASGSRVRALSDLLAPSYKVERSGPRNGLRGAAGTRPILYWGVSNFDVPNLEAAWESRGEGRIACNQVLSTLRSARSSTPCSLGVRTTASTVSLQPVRPPRLRRPEHARRPRAGGDRGKPRRDRARQAALRFLVRLPSVFTTLSAQAR